MLQLSGVERIRLESENDELREVDLGETSPGLAVTVAGGDRPRSVVVSRAYEPLVREALASHDTARRGRTASILGRSQSRRNITTPVTTHAVTARATNTVAIEVNRLRATWLVAAMSAPVPLGVLLAAAGLRSARSLCDLLAHCPDPGPAVVAAALAHLDHGWHLSGTGPAVIRRCEFDRALALVHRPGVRSDLEAILRPDGRGGRPRRLGVDVFLAGLICTVATKNTLALTNLHELLTKDLARSHQTALGIRDGFQAVTVRQVRYLLEAIENKLAFTEDRAPALTAVDRAERQAALQNIYDRLLAATMAEHLLDSGAYTLDDSGIDSTARGKRRRPPPSPPKPSRSTARLPTPTSPNWPRRPGRRSTLMPAGVTGPAPTTTAPTSCSATSWSPCLQVGGSRCRPTGRLAQRGAVCSKRRCPDHHLGAYELRRPRQCR